MRWHFCQRFTQTMRLPHSSMESSTVARSQGLKGLTTHTGGAAGMPCGGQGGGRAAGRPGRSRRAGAARKAWAGGSRRAFLAKQGHTYHRCVRRALARAKGRSVMHGEHPFWTRGVAKIEDRCRSCSYYAARRAPVSAQDGHTVCKEGFAMKRRCAMNCSTSC